MVVVVEVTCKIAVVPPPPWVLSPRHSLRHHGGELAVCRQWGLSRWAERTRSVAADWSPLVVVVVAGPALD